MVSNPVWEICEHVAEVQALLHDHVECGKHSAADVVAKAACRTLSYCGRCSRGGWEVLNRRIATTNLGNVVLVFAMILIDGLHVEEQSF